MWDIKQFKQLFMLETYSKQSYIFEAEKAEILDQLIETNKFVTISWARINVSNISSYYPIPVNDLYNLVVLLPEAVRSQALDIVWEYDWDGLITEYFLLKELRKKFKIELPDDRPTFISMHPNEEYISRLRSVVCESLYISFPNK